MRPDELAAGQSRLFCERSSLTVAVGGECRHHPEHEEAALPRSGGG
ncbi:MAG: hypothetical protein P8173_11750 [Gammaproteobacteria bacterium]